MCSLFLLSSSAETVVSSELSEVETVRSGSVTVTSLPPITRIVLVRCRVSSRAVSATVFGLSTQVAVQCIPRGFNVEVSPKSIIHLWADDLFGGSVMPAISIKNVSCVSRSILVLLSLPSWIVSQLLVQLVSLVLVTSSFLLFSTNSDFPTMLCMSSSWSSTKRNLIDLLEVDRWEVVSSFVFTIISK